MSNHSAPRPRRLRSLLLAALLTLVAAPAAASPSIEHWTTDNGLDVYFVRSPDLPLLDLELTFAAGSTRDGDTPGLARLTSNLLDEGAGGLDAGELARRFEDHGAELSASSDRDTASVRLRTLSDSDTRSAALEALGLVLSEPDFPEEAVARERQRLLTQLDNNQQDPGYLAREAFWEALYGDHPYGHQPGGTESGLEAVERDAVTEFFEEYYVRANASLTIVGDVSRDRAETMAHRLGDSLDQGEEAAAIPEPDASDRAGETIHVPFSSNQSHVLSGQVAYARGHPDHYALYTGNHILGGSGLVSQLAQAMREDRGLSYSVGSRFSPMKRAGPFLIRTQIRSDRTAEALDVLATTVSDLRDDGPEAEDHERAVKNITGSFPRRLADNRSILAHVANIGFHGLPLDYLETFPERIEALEPGDVQEALRKHLEPEAFVTVIVGPRDAEGETPEDDDS
ncbi:MAG: pitrilysin family protein [Ectothiorhodospiraceae bacterium]